MFFVLAIISAVGPNAAKIAKVFGALVIVAIMLTAPVGTVIEDIDAVIKNDLVATDEQGPTSDTGSKSSSNQISFSLSTIGDVVSAIDKQITGKLPGLGNIPVPGAPTSNLAQEIGNAVKNVFHNLFG